MKSTFFTFTLLFSLSFYAQQEVTPKMESIQSNTHNITGNVLNKVTREPIADVQIYIQELSLETYTNAQGQFLFKNIPSRNLAFFLIHGDYIITEFNYTPDLEEINIDLKPNSLELNEIVIIGQEDKKSQSTSTVINRKAIEHLQATNLEDILQLSPGGLVTNPSFAHASQANIRQYQADKLGSMGTAIIINGATLSNNANLQTTSTATAAGGATFSSTSGSGIDLRSISADNIESVEVVRGIPSVEYGDLNAGAILVQTKATKDPLQIKSRFNPKLTQFWAGQGLELNNNNGVLFLDTDFTQNTTNETNKNNKYNRATFNAQYTNTFGKAKHWRTNTTFSYTYAQNKQGLDPDFAIDSLKHDNKDHFLRFVTNGNITLDKKISRNIKYTLATSYGIQKGYQQRYYTADVTAESDALTDQIQTVPYLPSSYLSKMWVDGKPLSIQAKLTNAFDFYTAGISNNILIGTEYKLDANYGNGKTFTRPPRNTSGAAIRERAYNSIPSLHQLSFFIQDHINGQLANWKYNLYAGLRYDVVQPFGSDFNLSALSPRLNIALTAPHNMTFRAGYGITSKAPSLLYLYPEPAYFDFYSLNYYAQSPVDRIAMISTRVYDTTNTDIKLSKTNKYEVGFDYMFDSKNKRRFSINMYYEQTKNGYSMSTTLDEVNFATYPIYEVQQNINNQIVHIKDQTRFISYYGPTNNINKTNKGVELDLDLGKVNPINTSFSITGAYTYTQNKTNNNYILQQNIANRETTRIGVFAAGRGTVNERLSTLIRAIHHIPELRLVVSLSAQTIWKDQNKYIGYDSIPIGFIPFKNNDQHPDITYFTASERQSINKIDDADIYLNISDETYIKEKWNQLWLFNLKLTKEFKSGLSFSFFANNFINYRPLQSSTRYPNTFYKKNIEFFFGTELSFKI